VPTAYDPLISKVVAWAPDRPGAIARMVRALREYDVRGISTTIGFCRDLVASPAFAAVAFDTTYVDRLLEENGKKDGTVDGLEEVVAIAAAIWAAREADLKVGTTTETPAEDTTKTDDTKTDDTKTDVVPTFRSAKAAKPAESLWAQRGRLDGLR